MLSGHVYDILLSGKYYLGENTRFNFTTAINKIPSIFDNHFYTKDFNYA
jgi:hypothetical protein